MKKAQERACKKILDKEGSVKVATDLTRDVLQFSYDLMQYITYGEKRVLPEIVAHIYMGLEMLKDSFEITEEEIDTEINYAIEVKNEDLDLK